ncbi:hypothetical protein GIB67_001221 [Kingdonia uniflora]|uniref:Uncharacterized protein n=1 Tax=Kingdonia uniflora TaxID=39325 RepID=A0A7J7LGK2_9MAGN|nr:hypothetical protein GIB67_001221 [Kingdonia uniflora]
MRGLLKIVNGHCQNTLELVFLIATKCPTLLFNPFSKEFIGTSMLDHRFILLPMCTLIGCTKSARIFE